MPRFSTVRLTIAVLAFLTWAFPAAGADGFRTEGLRSARTWMYQLQGLDEAGAVDALAATDYPLLVVEPGHTLRDAPQDAKNLAARLRFRPDGRRRLVLAYLNLGQAEEYRTYWERDWRAPTADRPGRPDFLLSADPDGWSGNYPVAFWRPEWKRLLLGENGLAAETARLGFDGLYLDWVAAHDHPPVREAARREGLDPGLEMIRFVEEIRREGRRIVPDFLIVAQNAPELIGVSPERYLAAIDGLAVEDTWFRGDGDAAWDDPRAGDIPQDDDRESSAGRMRWIRKYLDAGRPVFSVDYCLSEENAAWVYREARRAGFRPLVTRVSLSRLTGTPPPVQ